MSAYTRSGWILLAVAWASLAGTGSQAPRAQSTGTPLHRAMVMEARDLAYTANYRNDQAGLRAAIAVLEPLGNDAGVGAWANYYASWSYWALAGSQAQAKDVAGALESGARAVARAQAALAVKPDDPEVITALINGWIVLAVLDTTQFEKAAGEIRPLRQRVLSLGAGNPRAVMMDAGMIFNNPPERGGGRDKGLARWLEAMRLFEAEASAAVVDPMAPRWGQALAHGWLAGLYLTMTPPRRQEARRAATTALAIRPDFWYVRDQLLPQLDK